MTESSARMVSIGDLMDGRRFFIPDYQRGYRWTERQVTDLLNDLFAYVKESKDDFYFLQPVIARQRESRGVWEIVDGQQRLTTLLILYKYLEQAGYKQEGLAPYHIAYQTRQKSEEFLDNINNPDESNVASTSNVDFFCMKKAYETISAYMAAKSDDEKKTLAFLFARGTDTQPGRLRVLWYELPHDEPIDPVKEFRKINSGKIPLTNAELIKALLLRKSNMESSSATLQQEQSALEWERIENRLHDDSFWSFLCDGREPLFSHSSSRIDFIFAILYRLDPENKKEGAAYAKLFDPRSNCMFAYFNKRLEQEGASEIWNDVQDLFWLLEDWYHDSITYNLIGLLTHCGVDVAKLVKGHHDSPRPRTQFVLSLKQMVGEKLPIYSELTYDKTDKKTLRLTLLAMNVSWLNRQCSARKKDREASQASSFDDSMYRFPFAVYDSMKWDIEHIDSFHTRELTGETAEKWLETALSDVTIEKDKIGEYNSKQNLYEKIVWLQNYMGETENSDEDKNGIGNLTLLDDATNRGYGNALFCTKRRWIIELMEKSTFVPPLTQFVFLKIFDKRGTRRSYWTEGDMKSYQEEQKKLLDEYRCND